MSFRAILVDDNAGFLSALQDYVELVGGVQVVGKAASCAEALKLLEGSMAELLIVDISMPHMNGLELARQVRLQWPHLLIIVLTLLDTGFHRDAALQAGAHAFVTKANMQRDLLPAIKNLAHNRN